MQAAGREHRTDPDEAKPKAKDQRNFADPQSKIMKTSNKGFDQCGNAQAVANEAQIIVAAGVHENTRAFTAHTGYFSESNMQSLEAHDRIDESFVATGRQKHNEPPPGPAVG